MTKDTWMSLQRSGDACRTWIWLALGAAVAGCSAGSSGGVPTQPGTTDASQSTGVKKADSGTGTPKSDAAEDLATDGGLGGMEAGTVNSSTADADGGAPDAGPTVMCVAHGQACGLAAGSELCCTDGCVNGICGCLSEGSKVISSSDAGGGACCGGLAEVDGGYCGTSACVPDGTPCADAGVICCNDNCNGSTCGSL